MSRRQNKGSNVVDIMLWGMLILLVGVGFWFAPKAWAFLTEDNTASARARENSEEIQELESRIDSLEANEKASWFWRAITFIGASFGLVGLPVWAYFKYRNDPRKKVLTLDQAVKKARELLQEKGYNIFWNDSNSFELTESGQNYYLLTFGLTPRPKNRNPNWQNVKHIGVKSDDWDGGRLESIPLGVSHTFAIKLVHEWAGNGFKLVRERSDLIVDALQEEVESARKTQENLSILGGGTDV